jgi:PKD repeat protein
MSRISSLRRAAAVTAVAIAATVAVDAPTVGADGTSANPNESVDTSTTPDALAQALVGPGVDVTGVAYTGPSTGRGTFAFADPGTVGFGAGVVLSSGSVTDVVGPNASDWTSTDAGQPGDDQLTALAGYPTYDASVLELDFVPDANQVVFQYAFASEEYPEWVNTPFNDVFAFWINDVNCAEVRQTAGDSSSPSVPVAVNNINASNPVQDPMPVAMRPDLFRANYVDPAASPIDLELDGITSVLTCQAPVTPGVTNHMKLAIADASDGIYDSAVFIEAGSLVSNHDPVADLSLWPSSGDAPLPVEAIIEGEDPDGAPLTYTVDWGDGSPIASGDLPNETAIESHTYTSGGSYLVTLTVSNGHASGTSIEDVDVFGPATPPSPPPAPVDTTPPTLVPALSTPSPLLVHAAGVTAAPNAIDDSGIASASCDAVDTSTAGAKSLLCTAVDTAGNTATAQLDYVVGYQLLNVKPTPGTTFKRTSSIPVSFKVADADGVLPDAAAATLRPSISVRFGGLAPVTPAYAKKSDTFSVTLATNKPAAGTYDVVIDIRVGAADVATQTVPVTIV